MRTQRRFFLKRLATLLSLTFVSGCDRGSDSGSTSTSAAGGASQPPAGGTSSGQTRGTTTSGSGTQAGTGSTGDTQTGSTGGTAERHPRGHRPVSTPFQVDTRFFSADRFQEALDALADGGTLIIRGGASYHVTGILRRNNVTVKALDGKATLDGLLNAGFPAQGKGLIVQQGRAATYEDLIFKNVVVSDDNGVGVRVEGDGTTTFRRCEFRDSQEGILTNNSSDCAIVMENCVGDNLGAGDGQSHGVYCGTIGSFTVTGGSWTNSKVGHLLKSRAARTRIENVQLVEGAASRAIDLPNGGVVEILGCTISQSQATNNSEIVGYGLEVSGPYWPGNSFTFRASNTVTNTRNPPGTVLSFAGWFTGPKSVERYTYNGSTSNPPGFTG
jgi:hypothetical protein